MPDRRSWRGLGMREPLTLDKDSFGGYLGFMSLRLYAIDGSWRRRNTSCSSTATAGSAAPSAAGSTNSPRGSATGSFAAWTLGRRRRVWPGDEGPEQFQLSAVAAVRPRELQDPRSVAETLVVDQESEGVLSELPFADVLMAVCVARQLALRIVEMERPDAGKSNGFVHVPQERLISFGGPEVVAGGEGVA